MTWSPFLLPKVPISLKMRSPFGPHFEKFRSSFHVGAVHLPGIEQNISIDVVVHHLVQYVLLDQIENMIRDPYFKWKYMHD